MSQALQALILGAGYAGEGHTLALQRAGVDVVAMASRTLASCQATAARLGIPHAGTDWRALLAEHKPAIVAVATPGGTHLAMASAAIEAGCHVYCDKPLALTAAEARQLYAQAKARGVKTAYAASFCYQPQALYARELVQQGVLGPIWEVECVSHYNWPRLMPFGWPHRLDQGGGRLNNNFTHKLAIVQMIVSGMGQHEVLTASGETRNDLRRAPVAQQIHDFRNYFSAALSPEAAAQGDWAAVDSDWAYTVLVRLGDPAAPLDDAVSATFRHSALHPGKHTDYVAVYGEKGVLHIEGAYAQGALYLQTAAELWHELTIPAHIHAALPEEADHSQRNWDQLARLFVADIRGERVDAYPAFRDGWIHQQVIDLVRAGSGRQAIEREIEQ